LFFIFDVPGVEPVIGSHGHGSEDVLSPKLLTKSDLTPLPPVGHCRPLPLQKALAFAMLSHARLGSNSKGEIINRCNLNSMNQTTGDIANLPNIET
jgi:hypothetical protein